MASPMPLPGTHLLSMQPLKGRKDPAVVLRGDPDSVVAHAECNTIAIGPREDPDVQRLRPTVFDRIPHQVLK